MKTKIIKATWGMEGMPLAEQFKKIAEAGYAGVESPLPSDEETAQFKELLARYNLDYVAMVFTGGEDHAASFEQQVERAVQFQPLLINSHSAQDSMPYNEQLKFFSRAIEIERQAGIQVGHETHRGRAMFTPWATAQLLDELPELKLTADFSHWCCVCESLLHDQEANLRRAFERTIHIHARVGYAEGPQVPHPGAPEYARELEAHVGWWQEIVNQRKAKGYDITTITPEFGPPGYLHTLPFTNQPVADLWEVCLWMTNHLNAKLQA
ncbi:sugar phosphate isomerase/epimerase family protein [Paenibacillus spongiae]|uniref:Sugar phosphate isomerase/epimerase n=1 Tax=Paenibacillus spongiae TaxID=2909671 RepID=A0ABY5SA16_9BACL|nr:sugar phosphate isomerase/epimerase [Paenibacillus spongiae]UVI29667.1 sugar phosphate isomerase/epimerase [Paenibacillus spongiae]